MIKGLIFDYGGTLDTHAWVFLLMRWLSGMLMSILRECLEKTGSLALRILS